ncbi:Gfo/Idh/MocA family protein [Phaeovulum sp.]|uniref:Gfo/Idh/MocA family protein n=1 Tax=Phaeovulum sp. TaxID=2934796 RepID=UPI0039E6AF4A
MSLGIGLVGLGAIARAQHLPALDRVTGVHLAALASRNATLPGLPCYPDVDALLAAQPDVGAISLCTPPQGRFEQAMAVLRAGRHLMLEKPPGATLSEVETLRAEAAHRGLTLFATWHSRAAAGVDAARNWLTGQSLRKVMIDWREDVRKWHPGQDWIWQAGGLGVFDPGINALSILTAVLHDPVRIIRADLQVPKGRQTPIAAQLEMRAADVAIHADFDWRKTGEELWRIRFETADGSATLDQGGARFAIDGQVQPIAESAEYARLYERFRDLVARGESDADFTPLRLVADAFMNGRLHQVAPFDEAADG